MVNLKLTITPFATRVHNRGNNIEYFPDNQACDKCQVAKFKDSIFDYLLAPSYLLQPTCRSGTYVQICSEPVTYVRNALVIQIFNAFTGCDTVSAFRGKGKKSAWLTRNVCDEVTCAFVTLSQVQTEGCDQDHMNLEHFVMLPYDRTSSSCVQLISVDKARL